VEDAVALKNNDKTNLKPVISEDSPPSALSEFWYFFKQNKGAVAGGWIMVLFILIAILAPLLAPHDPAEVYSNVLRQAPFWSSDYASGFYLGSDDVGRDVLSRLIHGARVSLGIGFFVVCISSVAGIIFGLIAGYFGGIIDTVIMRVVDIFMALPSILLAIVVVSVLGPNLINTILAVAIVAIPGFVRLVRASVLQEKKKQYVVASKSFGAGHFRLLILNILPNCIAPLVVQATLGFSSAILDAAALGFLGLGAQPPTPEWGTMLADARPFIESNPWLVTLPGICILVVVLSFNLLGDGLRDALDPRLKK
jgi:ABC-type dipeptide/oligopeptide/nickel transport system permease subunit